MVSALNGFGLVIGTMDIIGAFFFDLLILWFICHRKPDHPSECEIPPRDMHPRKVKMICGSEVTPWILKCYVVLLNIWIVVSALMIAGILLHKPSLIMSWLIWCLGGLLFDLIFLCWWIVEIFTGDAIEAFTNIMISFLTMTIEFGFIYVIYNVYKKMSRGSTELEEEISTLERFSNYIF